MKKLAFVMAAFLFLTGCSTMKPQDFAHKTPKLDIFDYFDGQTEAWGIFEDRFGNLRREFRVDITGTITDGTLKLDEKFDYSDGEKDQRIWYITRTAANQYEGRASDIIGTATGISAGNALNWKYQMDLKVGDSSYRVTFDDWMYLQAGNVLVNRARVTKWGIELGEVSLFFKKPANVSSNN